MTKQTTLSAKRGPMLDTQRLADTLVSGAKSYIDKAMGAVFPRLDALEKRTPEKGDTGPKGEKGEPGDPGRDGVDGKDGAKGADGRDGKDGVDGKNGTSVTIDDVLPALTEHVDAFLSAVPAPKDGKDADPELVKALVDEAVARIPAPHNGKDGRDGVDGKDGRDGQDGIGVAGAFLNKDGGLVLTTSDGRTHELGIVVGRDGRDGERGPAGANGANGNDGVDGKDGADGLGFDDLDVEYDGERGFAFKFVRGDRVKSFNFTMPVILDRGIYKAGTVYTPGDVVTWGGSMWIAQEETNGKPGEKGWRLAVKHGQNGKDGVLKEPKKHEPVRFRDAVAG